MESNRTRIAELEALFAAAGEEDFEDTDETGVLPDDEVKTLKEELKEATATYKQAFKEVKALAADLYTELKLAWKLPAGADKRDYTVQGKATEPDFASARPILALAEQAGLDSSFVPALRDALERGEPAHRRAVSAEQKLATHKALEDEVKQRKADIRATEKKRDALIAAAREHIDADEAKRVILERLHRVLRDTYTRYLTAHQRNCLKALENLHDKYAVTATEIESQRDAATAKLKQFLEELGYG